MKHKEIEGNNTSLINRYIARYFIHIFRVVILYLNMKAKRIILFTMIMLFLPLSLLSDDNDTFFDISNTKNGFMSLSVSIYLLNHRVSDITSSSKNVLSLTRYFIT